MLGTGLYLRDLIAGADFAFFQDTKVETGPTV
jgi:hypothetical protein